MCNNSNYMDASETMCQLQGRGAAALSEPAGSVRSLPKVSVICFCAFFLPAAAAWRSAPYLRGNTVKVLSQHPPHVLAGVRGHLVLEQEGELAALADAVEVAVDLVVLAACQKKDAGSS